MKKNDAHCSSSMIVVCCYQIRAEHSEKQMFEEGRFWTACDICEEQIAHFLEYDFLNLHCKILSLILLHF